MEPASDGFSKNNRADQPGMMEMAVCPPWENVRAL